MKDLSVVIITLNAERYIENCIISALMISDDIIILDSGSTDQTESIIKKYPVKFIYTEWKGYGNTKNYGNSLAKNDWILSLDSDEEISEDLQKAITDLPENPPVPAFKLMRLNNYCGQWIKHGAWHPEYRVRLFNRKFAEWNRSDVHEDMILKSGQKPGIIKQAILHYSMSSLEEHKAKTDKYAKLWAKSKNGNVNPLKLFLSPVFKFIKDYVLRQGFLDGKNGFIIARENARYTWLKYKLLKEKSK